MSRRDKKRVMNWGVMEKRAGFAKLFGAGAKMLGRAGGMAKSVGKLAVPAAAAAGGMYLYNRFGGEGGQGQSPIVIQTGGGGGYGYGQPQGIWQRMEGYANAPAGGGSTNTLTANYTPEQSGYYRPAVQTPQVRVAPGR